MPAHARPSNETLFLEDPFLLVTQENIDDPEVAKYFNSFDCAVDGGVSPRSIADGERRVASGPARRSARRASGSARAADRHVRAAAERIERGGHHEQSCGRSRSGHRRHDRRSRRQRSAQDAPVDGTGKTITLVNAVQNNPYFTSLQCGAQKAADETGATLDVQAPAQFDAALQNQVIEAAAARGPDALLVNTVFGQEASPLVQSIIDAGTPVVVVENLTEVTGEVASIYMDQVEMGRMAGHVMAEQIGEEGKVWVIDFQAGVKGTDDRLTGFQEVDRRSTPASSSSATSTPATTRRRPPRSSRASSRRTPTSRASGAPTSTASRASSPRSPRPARPVRSSCMAPDALPNEVDWLRNGEAYGLIAEKPYQVAYQAVYAALENLAGQREPVDEPQALEDAFVLMTADNIDDPEVALYFNTETCPA